MVDAGCWMDVVARYLFFAEGVLKEIPGTNDHGCGG